MNKITKEIAGLKGKRIETAAVETDVLNTPDMPSGLSEAALKGRCEGMRIGKGHLANLTNKVKEHGSQISNQQNPVVSYIGIL